MQESPFIFNVYPLSSKNIKAVVKTFSNPLAKEATALAS